MSRHEGRDGGRPLHVLRLCSVFEAAPGDLGAARYDPVGGMQNHTAALTRSLDDRDVVQTVVTSRLGGPRSRTRLGRRAEVVRVGAHLARFRQLWALAALPVVVRPRRDEPGREPVSLVHAHQGEDVAALLLARLAAVRHRCPLVVTVHVSITHTLRGSSPRARLLRAVGGPVERAVLRRADAVVVLAARTARLLAEDGVDASRLHVVPSGFEPAVFARAPSRDPFPDVGRPRVGYVGRLAPQKRPDRVLAAYERLRCPAHLVVVGDGPDRRTVTALARASARRDTIALRGFVPHHEVPEVLAALDVLVLPSAYEELGSVLVEAMAVGLPVVACRTGGIPDVVRDGTTGLLVPCGDVDALAGAIDRLLADPQLRARLSTGARRRAREYAWPALGRRVLELYHEVTGGQPADAAAEDVLAEGVAGDVIPTDVVPTPAGSAGPPSAPAPSPSAA